MNVATDGPIVVTDPPYYDNIHYADSSDFFYVWLRSQIRDQYPDLFASMLAPKNDEMVAIDSVIQMQVNGSKLNY